MTAGERMEKILQEMDSNRKVLAGRKRDIAEDKDLTAEAKGQRIAEVRAKALAKHKELRKALEAERAKGNEETMRAAFSAGPEKRAEYNAALARAERASSRGDLLLLAQRALDTNDLMLLRAVCYRGVRAGHHDLVCGPLHDMAEAGGLAEKELAANLRNFYDFHDRYGDTRPTETKVAESIKTTAPG
jgi:hypothetical protein